MEKFKKIKKASILGVLCNIFLFIIKFIAGLLSHSQAMIVDSFNSLSDIISSIMTFIGNRIASIPKDDDHDLGHGKAEYIYAMIISFIMFLITIKLLYNSFMALIIPSKYIFSYWLIVVCLLTIFIKFCLYKMTINIAREYDNILIKSNAIDHRNDCIITAFNMVSVLLSSKGLYLIDGIVGIGISIWMFIGALEIFKNSYNVLMDKAISKETKDEVLDIIRSHKEVIKVDHFNSTPIGYQYQISFTIFVDGNLTTFESHDIANNLEKEIDRKVPKIFLTVIHVNPIITTVSNKK